jgi:hypothetical protein
LIKISNLAPKGGISKDKPIKPIMTVAARRRLLGSIGNILTMVEIKSVNIVKLVITPRVMPSDFLFPPPDEAENTIGKRGHMQGAKIVMNPARNEKIRSVTIILR